MGVQCCYLSFDPKHDVNNPDLSARITELDVKTRILSNFSSLLKLSVII